MMGKFKKSHDYFESNELIAKDLYSLCQLEYFCQNFLCGLCCGINALNDYNRDSHLSLAHYV